MGRAGNKGRGRGRGRGKSSGGAPRESKYRDEQWSAVPEDNEKFNAYYKAQGILPDEEWPEFLAALHRPLPTTFRITGCREIAGPLNQMIKDTFVPFLSGVEHEGALLAPPRPIEWYPNELAWQLDIPKQVIRKNEGFRKFQHFLVHETSCGNISRQEAVSMIPPLLLDVLPHHCVLDLCAAPGSKSVQLLEALHALPGATTDPNTSSILPAGLLIANDSDAKRCHMLVHQSLHRIPSARMMVTNHDATQIPGLRIPGVAVEGAEPGAEPGTAPKWQALYFDRILADVPCSGDGTLRKNLGIWKDWGGGNALGLHGLQLRILLRGINLLKPGGRLVYSTCSLNPVENEAVVSAALEACPDMSLIEVSDLLPKLIRRPGLTTWKVFDNTNTPAPHPTHNPEGEEVHDRKGQKKVWAPSLWPNGKEKERGLEKCLRIYPHDQDTGGFFVSVLVKSLSGKVGEVSMEEEKVEVPIPGASESSKRTVADRASSPATEEQPDAKRAKAELDGEAAPEEEVELPVVEAVLASLPPEVGGAAPSKAPEFKEEPFTYLPEDDEQVKICMEFFDLLPTFPTSSLLVRNAAGAPLRSIYFTSNFVKDLLSSNSYRRMRLISCGVKVFARQDSGKDGMYTCKWRLMSEGLEVLRPFMGPKRIVKASCETLKFLMADMNVLFSQLVEVEFKEALEKLLPGSCVLEVEAEGTEITLEQKLVIPLWRSAVSVNLMVEKSEKSALSLRLFGEDITPHAAKPKAPRGTGPAAAEVEGEGDVVVGEGSGEVGTTEEMKEAEGDESVEVAKTD